MIELERHIEILLLNNDCVIVPGLGGFMAHYAEAHYDDRDRSFVPPMRTLGFNPALKMNDSLLVQSYIEAYDISYPEALLRIEDEVNELQQHIENQGFYALNDIGVLRVNEDGNYEFEPCEAGILTPSLYGLTTVEIEALDQMKTATLPVDLKPIATEKTEEEHTEKTAQRVKMDFSNLSTEEDGKHVRVRVSVLRNIAAAVIALFVFLLFSTPLNNGVHQETNVLNTKMLTKIMPKVTVLGADKVTTPIAKTEEAVKPAETAKTVEPVKTAETAELSLNLSAHSLRSGFVTTAIRQGKTERSIMNQTGHKSTQVLREYFQREDAIEDNAAQNLL